MKLKAYFKKNNKNKRTLFNKTKNKMKMKMV